MPLFRSAFEHIQKKNKFHGDPNRLYPLLRTPHFPQLRERPIELEPNYVRSLTNVETVAPHGYQATSRPSIRKRPPKESSCGSILRRMVDSIATRRFGIDLSRSFRKPTVPAKIAPMRNPRQPLEQPQGHFELIGRAGGASSIDPGESSVESMFAGHRKPGPLPKRAQ